MCLTHNYVLTGSLDDQSVLQAPDEVPGETGPRGKEHCSFTKDNSEYLIRLKYCKMTVT